MKRSILTSYLAILVATTVFTNSVVAKTPDFLANSVYEKVGLQESVEPELLYAISLTESALSGGKKNIKPYIYAIRTPKGAIYPPSLESAKKALSNAINQFGYKGIDVGLMQINGQHWKHIRNKASLFNAFYNVRFGAQILKKAINSTSNRQIGIGRYHSFTDWRAKAYSSRVLAIYNNLKALD